MHDLLPPMFEDWAFRAGLDGPDLWVAAPDVARILGYRESHDMTRSLDDDEKGPRLVRTLGGEQTVTVITEAGLYKAIMQRQSGRIENSDVRDRVQRFQRWVTHDVLPAIRRTGTYSTAPALTEDEIVHQALTITARKVEALTARVAELEPRAAVADHLLDATGDMSVGDAAKTLARSGAAIGQQRLFEFLDAIGWTYRSGGVRHIKQSAIEAGVLAALPKSHHHPRTGELVVDPPQVRVTPKGIARLLPRLRPAEEAA